MRRVTIGGDARSLGAAGTVPRPQPPTRQRRRGDAGDRAGIPGHVAEAIAARPPLVARFHDFVVGAGDEVPPHDDLLLEGEAAD